MNRILPNRYLLPLLVFPCLLPFGTAWAAPITARAGVSANNVYVGEEFRFQIQISGSDQPEPVDLSRLQGFTVQSLGGGANNRRSVVIVNGKMKQDEQRGYVLSYSLTPKQAGTLQIPPITIRAEGQTAKTQPITIVVNTPTEVDNFKLRISLSKEEAYVGEPIVLEVMFYYGAPVEDARLNLPLLQDANDYFVYDLPENAAAPKAVSLGGKSYQTMRLRKVIIPKHPGSTTLAPATLAFQGVIGYRTGRDIFGRTTREPSYQRFVIPSNELPLTIREVPQEGKPPGFAGHVGEYQISATATPSEVDVGEPITLTVSLSGPPYLDHIELPPLREQAGLTNDFRIPAERESGKVQGEYKFFTQTLRAENDKVAEIPPIELPYFDTASGTYKIAKSEPIPLKVRPTKVVDIRDAEGSEPIDRSSAVEAWKEGIAYNYEDLDALVDQQSGPQAWLGSPVWMATLVAPPVLYLALLATLTSIRKRHADPQGVRARRAHAELVRKLKAPPAQDASAELDRVLAALRGYLGDKLRVAPGALTFKDVHQPLANKGADPQAIQELKDLFQRCEAGRYAGRADADAHAAASQCLELAQRLERLL